MIIEDNAVRMNTLHKVFVSTTDVKYVSFYNNSTIK